jgi:hypothetical protein
VGVVSVWAKGSRAFGFCDYCGFRYPLHELKNEYVNLVLTGIKACPSCWSEDHPQLQVGRYPIDDPQALQDPRPDIGIVENRGLFGWDPLLDQRMDITLGTVQWSLT